MSRPSDSRDRCDCTPFEEELAGADRNVQYAALGRFGGRVPFSCDLVTPEAMGQCPNATASREPTTPELVGRTLGREFDVAPSPWDSCGFAGPKPVSVAVSWHRMNGCSFAHQAGAVSSLIPSPRASPTQKSVRPLNVRSGSKPQSAADRRCEYYDLVAELNDPELEDPVMAPLLRCDDVDLVLRGRLSAETPPVRTTSCERCKPITCYPQSPRRLPGVAC